VHVVHGAENILGLLQSGDETPDPRSTACNRLEQIAEPFDAYPGPVPLLEVCRLVHLLEGLSELGGLLLNQFPGHLPKGRLPLPGPCPDLDAESAKPASKLDSRFPKPTANLGGRRVDGLAFASFQPSNKPEQPRHILDSKAIALKSQPIEVHLGVPPSIGCQGQLPQTSSHFFRHAALELRPIGTGTASKAPEADSKIVQRLGIPRVRQPCLGAFYLIDETQRE
jgi:hypothetical protein